MVTYWLFQFMGAFTAAAVYKIVCNLAALHTAPQVCRVLPKVLAMHSSRNFFRTNFALHGTRFCRGAPHLAVVAPVPPFNAGYVPARVRDDVSFPCQSLPFPKALNLSV